ncbi:MAG: hypothetical protein HY273_01540 [Gammaproteobacteria bacterium]|nr:hypothetical protein [Gammaproteobacteria bacterium]
MLASVFSVFLGIAAMNTNESMTDAQVITLAKQAVSKQLAVPVEQLGVQHAQAVDWPDSSLGCPQPGMMYMQVITPGFKVEVTAGKELYPVHIAGARAVVCVRGAGNSTAPKAQAAQATVDVLRRARERLATTLNVDAANIQVHTIRAGSPDTTAACAEEASGGNSGGKRVELEYAGKRYEYRTDTDTVRECAGP